MLKNRGVVPGPVTRRFFITWTSNISSLQAATAPGVTWKPVKDDVRPAVLSREAWDPKHYNSGHQVQHHPDQQIQICGLR